MRVLAKHHGIQWLLGYTAAQFDHDILVKVKFDDITVEKSVSVTDVSVIILLFKVTPILNFNNNLSTLFRLLKLVSTKEDHYWLE